ncbi:hypothetical protein D8682_02275 [Buttiauxella sp. 3AFRM03]|uniref:Uncharacterized protein n=1 Tax=Buttiauxella brennerae ATCC 51605 TaxID=1354251 RepID=A0A1B7IRA8_9ENTR|nr:hypothetical protein D8682_02275 [Buttiauxella sp. 3AFRM03]OAT32298.1 hypothetical protein M975_1433 [Buttiauxella brennerae ATCC 51605]
MRQMDQHIHHYYFQLVLMPAYLVMEYLVEVFLVEFLPEMAIKDWIYVRILWHVRELGAVLRVLFLYQVLSVMHLPAVA